MVKFTTRVMVMIKVMQYFCNGTRRYGVRALFHALKFCENQNKGIRGLRTTRTGTFFVSKKHWG